MNLDQTTPATSLASSALAENPVPGEPQLPSHLASLRHLAQNKLKRARALKRIGRIQGTIRVGELLGTLEAAIRPDIVLADPDMKEDLKVLGYQALATLMFVLATAKKDETRVDVAKDILDRIGLNPIEKLATLSADVPLSQEALLNLEKAISEVVGEPKLVRDNPTYCEDIDEVALASVEDIPLSDVLSPEEIQDLQQKPENQYQQKSHKRRPPICVK